MLDKQPSHYSTIRFPLSMLLLLPHVTPSSSNCNSNRVVVQFSASESRAPSTPSKGNVNTLKSHSNEPRMESLESRLIAWPRAFTGLPTSFVYLFRHSVRVANLDENKRLRKDERGLKREGINNFRAAEDRQRDPNSPVAPL